MEILKPWSSSSETISTVPAFPSLRTTALPTSSASASWNARRIVDARSLAAGMSFSLSLPRSGFPVSNVVLQAIVRWRRLRPEIAGFGFVVSVLIKSTHIACIETERSWRREIFVDVRQIETEVIAASEVISLVQHRPYLCLRDRSGCSGGDVDRAVGNQLEVSLYFIIHQDVDVHTQASAERSLSQQEGFRQRQDRRSHASIHVHLLEATSVGFCIDQHRRENHRDTRGRGQDIPE